MALMEKNINTYKILAERLKDGDPRKPRRCLEGS